MTWFLIVLLIVVAAVNAGAAAASRNAGQRMLSIALAVITGLAAMALVATTR